MVVEHLDKAYYVWIPVCTSLFGNSSSIKEGTIYGSWIGYFNFMYVFSSLVTGFSY